MIAVWWVAAWGVSWLTGSSFAFYLMSVEHEACGSNRFAGDIGGARTAIGGLSHMVNDLKSAIRFDDSIDVQIEIGKLLEEYRPLIGRDADNIVLRFPGSNLSRIAAAAYIKELGSEIPDRAVRAAVKNLAADVFARREIARLCAE